MIKQKRKISIKTIIFWSCALFISIIFVLLLLLQTVYLQEIYKLVRQYSLYRTEKSAVEKISAETDTEQLFAWLDREAEDENMSIRIFDQDGQYFYCSIPDVKPLSLNTLAKVKSLTADGKSYYGEVINETSQRLREDSPDGELAEIPKASYGGSRLVRISKVTIQGNEYYLTVAAIVTPVGASVDIIRTELIFVSLIMLIIGPQIAFTLAKHLIKPIGRISEYTSQIAAGNYRVHFGESASREISEIMTALQSAAERLESVDILQQELIANVSHDLRTPLTMITAYAEMMKDLPGEMNADNCQVIIDEAKRLTGMVNNLLDISKLQSGTDAPKFAEFSLTQCIRESVARVQKLSVAEGFQIIFEEDREVIVCADELKIGQVLYNLLNNAINFSGARKEIVVSQKVAGKSVRVEVRDFGQGIEKEKLERIWDRFYRAGRGNIMGSTGNGLGLSIVKRILLLHNAKYGVESEPWKGSTFWFELPL